MQGLSGTLPFAANTSDTFSSQCGLPGLFLFSTVLSHSHFEVFSFFYVLEKRVPHKWLRTLQKKKIFKRLLSLKVHFGGFFSCFLASWGKMSLS